MDRAAEGELAEYAGLPGHELIQAGLSDLRRGDASTPEALLVAIGAPSLRRLGLTLPDELPDAPEHSLYDALARAHGDAAHGRYNALIRRLVSFERAARAPTR